MLNRGEVHLATADALVATLWANNTHQIRNGEVDEALAELDQAQEDRFERLINSPDAETAADMPRDALIAHLSHGIETGLM